MSKIAFKSLLASMPVGMNKESAGIESPDEVQLEQDFGRMAYLFLKDRAAGLIPYLLGFEIVDREEDGSKAVGIFGFKLGEDYYYVPAFFTSGQIKGMDLLYSKSTNMFMPLRESWVNTIVNKQTIALGDGVGNVDNLRRTFEQPRFDFLAVPPNLPAGTVPKVAQVVDVTDEIDNGDVNECVCDAAPGTPHKAGCPMFGKTACENGNGPRACKCPRGKCTCKKQTISNKALDVVKTSFDVWNEMQNAMSELLEKDADFQMAWAGAISKLEKKPLPFDKTAEGSDLITFLQNRGGPAAVKALFEKLSTDYGFAKAALTFYPSIESLYVSNFDANLAPVKKADKIEVLSQVTDYMDGKSKQRIVRDGFTLKDNRDEPEKSEVYEVDYPKRFQNPEQNGLYDVLLRHGGTTQAWVFQPAAASKNQNMVVVEPTKKHYFLAEPGAVFVRGDEITEGKNPYSETVALQDMEIGNKYIAIDDKGNATMPFIVSSVMAENGERIRVKINWQDWPVERRPSYGHDFETLGSRNRLSRSTIESASRPDYLEFGGFNSRVISGSGQDTWVIPNNWKALLLGDDASCEVFKPGTLTDVEAALTKNAFHKLAVESDGVEYHIRFDDQFQDGRGMNYKTAMLRLVSKYGLPVDAAEDILKEANDGVKARRMVKLGQYASQGAPTSNLVGYSMPGDPGQATGIDSFTGATVVQPQVDLMRGKTIGQTPPINSIQPGFNLGGEAQQDLQAGNLAQQAAQAGQKKVFDHAAIGGLSKAYDSNAIIDTYIPELTKALDRVGRVLFLFYWKNEDFSERYGSEDMAEMEDMIRGVFKSFGDLVLQLKKKSVEPEDKGSALM